MPKFSVKKPLTVFVAVVAVLVLGVVAYLRMTPRCLQHHHQQKGVQGGKKAQRLQDPSEHGAALGALLPAVCVMNPHLPSLPLS